MIKQNAPTDTPRLRYILYARKSTEDEQGQKNSIPDQIAACKRYAKDNNLDIVSIVEEKKSAKVADNRPLFAQMIKDIKAGVYDGILSWHPDRLARNMLEAGIIIDLIDNSVLKDLQFCQFHFDNNASGKMMLGMLFVFSKQYSDSLSERVQRGVDGNIERGISGGQPKWGYVRNEETGHYEPDKNYEPIREAWRMRYEDKASCQKIFDYLKGEGVCRTAKSSKVVRRPSTSTLENIFRDPFYYGLLLQGNNEIHLCEKYDFKPIITEEIYMEVQKIGHSTDKKQGRIRGERRIFKPLAGMVRCGVCSNVMGVNRSMPRDKSGRILYYTCHNKQCDRKTKNTPAKCIFDQIYELFDNLKLNEETFNEYDKQITYIAEDRLTEIRKEIKSKNALKQALQIDLDRIPDKLGKATNKDVIAKLNEDADRLSIEISIIHEQIGSLKDKCEDPSRIKLSKEEFLNLTRTLGDKMRAADVIQKDAICRKVFLNLVLDDEKRLTYRCDEPFDALLALQFPNLVAGVGFEPTTFWL